MSAIVRMFRKLLSNKVTQKDVLTTEMVRELRSIRINEKEQAAEIRRLRLDLEMANNRHKIFSEQLKASYLKIFTKKLLEIRGQQFSGSARQELAE